MTARDDLAEAFVHQFPATLAQYSHFKIVDWFVVRLAAKPTDDGVLQVWMARNKAGCIDPYTAWKREPSSTVKDMHAKGGWEIVPVEIRALSTKAKP